MRTGEFMLVTTLKDGSYRTGLLIGEANARRYFPRSLSSIELQLDDLHIQCALEPDFWRGRPEIHDPRLSGWLEFKAGRAPSGHGPMQLAMVRSGADKFVVRTSAAQSSQAYGAEVMLPVHRESRFSIESERDLETRSVA
jgi:hypothetical protein